ncbi:MAG: penicillin-binding protein activator [Myxococcota bacterium]
MSAKRRGARWKTGALALTLSLAAAACLPRMVVVNGTEMPYEEGAETVLRQGQQALTRGDRVTAEIRFKEVLQLFGDSDLVPYALDGLAKIVFEDGGCEASARYDQQLLSSFRRHPGAQRAQSRQSGCASSQTVAEVASRYTDAFDQAGSEAERLDVAQRAVSESKAAGDYLEAVRWLMRLRELQRDPLARQDSQTEISELIDGKLSANSLRALADSLPGREFPAARVNAKLAMLLEHSGNAQSARSTLERYLATWPTGEFAETARRRLERIDAQQQVQPGTLGVLLPLSGRHKAFGRLALQAIKLGLGLRGRSTRTPSGVKVVIVDTKSDAAVAADGVDALVEKHGVQAILGPIFRYEAERSAFRAQALGVPLLTISLAENLPKIGPYVFRNGVTAEDQVKALVAHSMDVMGMRTFAILYPRHPYGEELTHLFWDEVERKGGEIRGAEAYDVDTTTFTKQVRRLVARQDLELRADFRKARDECENQPNTYRQARCRSRVAKELPPIIDFEGLFVPHYPPTISMISAALAAEDIIVEQDPRRLGIIEKTLGRTVKPVTLLGANGWNSSKVLERSGRNVENAIFTDGFFAGAEQKDVAEFVIDYRKRFNRTPRLYPEALFFDSARIMSKVLSERPATREEVRQALTDVRDFPGVTGSTSFNGSNVAQRPIQILKIKDGQFEPVPAIGGPVRSRPKTN